MNAWNAWFAEDRWKILRIVHEFWGKNSGPIANQSNLMLINRYNGKAKVKELDGHWQMDDFPGDTFR